MKSEQQYSSGKLPEGLNDATTLGKNLRERTEKEWNQRGQKMALDLFQQMSSRVPAYRDFLASQRFDPKNVNSIEDFKSVPTIDKDSYLRKYSRKDLSWDGRFGKGLWSISTTSGSTGRPFYFPRTPLQDKQYALIAEQYLLTNFSIHKKRTLYIIAFPMGAWIGGLFTYEALRDIASNGLYDLSIITPGINKQEVINAVIELSSDYDQVIIGSYAPFLKDIIDDGKRAGIDWKKLDVGFVFSAEAFSEHFRDFVIRETGLKNDLTGTLNHYGTVDMGTMAHETPVSILIRRELFEEESLRLPLLPEALKQPTLAQYIPELYYFEQLDHRLVCSSFSGIPLVRYDLKDYGGLLSFDKISESFEANDINLNEIVSSKDITSTKWNLPFVYVYERDDFSVSYYAFIVYPDYIRRALEQNEIEKYVTGKFTMVVGYNDAGRQHLHTYIELRYGVSKASQLRKSIAGILHERLVKDCSEYREAYRMMGDVIKPIVNLFDYEDPRHFKPGTKQKWVIKS